MRIAFITAGAAGMYCGSCMRDNTLVAALRRLGHDALLIPTYTPIRTDEADVSQDRVFLGGINVYLQQKARLFRHTPRLVDWLLDRPRLLRWVSRFAGRMKYSELGGMTVSMLRGDDGMQRKEVARLAGWLAAEVRPEVVVFSNALLSGVIPRLKHELGVPVLVTLQGDDIFLDALPAADRRACVDLIRKNTAAADGFLTTSRYYADHMAGYLGVPRDKMHVVYPGLNLAGHGGPRPARRDGPLTVGYFARVCPEKGFHHAVEAFIHLRRTPGVPAHRLRASGWLGENDRPFFEEQHQKLAAAGLSHDFEYVASPTHADKVRFFRSVDVLTVPTTYREPKGLYLLEAWANGVPVVQPAHGAFPELVGATGGGLLVPPGDPPALAAGLRRLLDDHEFREATARVGAAAVRERFTAEVMAKETSHVLSEAVRMRNAECGLRSHETP
ncbi:MAG: glycosyltransferase family 4 protein [Gemmataceae bacterium]|nr:glycosyltransferase family 4 protein [Gemmataceae bacterium]